MGQRGHESAQRAVQACQSPTGGSQMTIDGFRAQFSGVVLGRETEGYEVARGAVERRHRPPTRRHHPVRHGGGGGGLHQIRSCGGVRGRRARRRAQLCRPRGVRGRPHGRSQPHAQRRRRRGRPPSHLRRRDDVGRPRRGNAGAWAGDPRWSDQPYRRRWPYPGRGHRVAVVFEPV